MHKLALFSLAVFSVQVCIADDGPNESQITSFVSQLTPQQQAVEIAVAKSRLASFAKDAKTPNEKRSLAMQLVLLNDAIAKKSPLFPLIDLPPKPGAIGRLPELSAKEIRSNGDVISEVRLSNGNPLSIPGSHMSLEEMARSVPRIDLNPHFVQIEIKGLKPDKMLRGNAIITGDLFWAVEAGNGKSKTIVLEKADKDQIIQTWKKAFTRK